MDNNLTELLTLLNLHFVHAAKMQIEVQIASLIAHFWSEAGMKSSSLKHRVRSGRE